MVQVQMLLAKLFMPLFSVIFVLALMVQPSFAQRLLPQLSELEISINSTFTGESLTLFGTIEADIGSNVEVKGPFDIIILVQGSAVDRVVREKSRQAGIWLNTQQVTFKGAPSFFHVLSSRPIEDINSAESLIELGIDLTAQVQEIDGPSEQIEIAYTNELKRLMQEAGTYGLSAHAVPFHSPTFYSAHLELPSDVPNGTYLATTFLFKDGTLLDRSASRFFVRTIGMEKFISNSARDFPLAYGIACVLLALFTGWLGGVAFRR